MYARPPVGSSADWRKFTYSAAPSNDRPSQSVSSSRPASCGIRLYGGVTGGDPGSCSVWKLCARNSACHGPRAHVKPPSRGSELCDVTAMRSERSAKYVSSETLLRLR